METGCKGSKDKNRGTDIVGGLTHVGVEGKVVVSSELISGAATPVLKHMQVGLALKLGGRREGP